MPSGAVRTSTFVSMASAAHVAATTTPMRKLWESSALNGLCGRCHCDRSDNLLVRVVMSQWPLRPVSLRRPTAVFELRTTFCLNGLCGPCRCDPTTTRRPRSPATKSQWLLRPVSLQRYRVYDSPHRRVSMASAAHVAATLERLADRLSLFESQWPLRPMSLRRRIRAPQSLFCRPSQWPLRPMSLRLLSRAKSSTA